MALTTWTAGQRLDADDLNDAFDWVRPRAVLLTRQTDAVLAASTETTLPMDAAGTGQSDPDAMRDVADGTFVIPVAGLWWLYGEVYLNSAPATMYVGVAINGVTGVSNRSYYAAPASTTPIRFGRPRLCAAGDEIALIVWSAAITTVTESGLGAFMMRRTA